MEEWRHREGAPTFSHPVDIITHTDALPPSLPQIHGHVLEENKKERAFFLSEKKLQVSPPSLPSSFSPSSPLFFTFLLHSFPCSVPYILPSLPPSLPPFLPPDRAKTRVQQSPPPRPPKRSHRKSRSSSSSNSSRRRRKEEAGGRDTTGQEEDGLGGGIEGGRDGGRGGLL